LLLEFLETRSELKAFLARTKPWKTDDLRRLTKDRDAAPDPRTVPDRVAEGGIGMTDGVEAPLGGRVVDLVFVQAGKENQMKAF
jgi:hypothetical protein